MAEKQAEGAAISPFLRQKAQGPGHAPLSARRLFPRHHHLHLALLNGTAVLKPGIESDDADCILFPRLTRLELVQNSSPLPYMYNIYAQSGASGGRSSAQVEDSLHCAENPAASQAGSGFNPQAGP